MCYVLSSGVEHLLRDVKDTTISTLATEVMFHGGAVNIGAALFVQCP
jgi:hypothetical protein